MRVFSAKKQNVAEERRVKNIQCSELLRKGANGACCIFVEDRKRSTLLPIIQRHIDPSCHIHHDGLAVYDNLASVGYQHSVVNHNIEFSTANGVHTNTIEGLWSLIKQRISCMHGLPSLNSLAALLDEFSYRQIYSIDGSIWNCMIEDIQKLISQRD